MCSGPTGLRLSESVDASVKAHAEDSLSACRKDAQTLLTFLCYLLRLFWVVAIIIVLGKRRKATRRTWQLPSRGFGIGGFDETERRSGW